MASLINDGASFFINVINDPVFQATGKLYTSEPGGAWGLHWVVIDPRRHQLFTWKKANLDFVADAASQNASVVTNGPFFSYKGGSKRWAVVRVGLRSIWELVSAQTISMVNPLLGAIKMARVGTNIRRSMVANFSAENPVGHIHGWWGSEVAVGAPNSYIFGRFGGRQFRNYLIAKGNPNPTPEVISGLIPTVLNYQVVNTSATTNQFGYWGLAPLDPTALIWQQANLQLPLKEAIDSYKIYEDKEEMELPKLDGLLITAFQSIRPVNMANMLSGVLVKDAVQLDGADSVLLGVDKTIVVGASMIEAKRLGNTWGYLTIAG